MEAAKNWSKEKSLAQVFPLFSCDLALTIHSCCTSVSLVIQQGSVLFLIEFADLTGLNEVMSVKALNS